jgi:hypothetical protein
MIELGRVTAKESGALLRRETALGAVKIHQWDQQNHNVIPAYTAPYAAAVMDSSQKTLQRVSEEVEVARRQMEANVRQWEATLQKWDEHNYNAVPEYTAPYAAGMMELSQKTRETVSREVVAARQQLEASLQQWQANTHQWDEQNHSAASGMMESSQKTLQAVSEEVWAARQRLSSNLQQWEAKTHEWDQRNRRAGA